MVTSQQHNREVAIIPITNERPEATRAKGARARTRAQVSKVTWPPDIGKLSTAGEWGLTLQNYHSDISSKVVNQWEFLEALQESSIWRMGRRGDQCHGHQEECLLKKKANISNQDNFSKSSLHESLIKEDSELVIQMFLL